MDAKLGQMIMDKLAAHAGIDPSKADNDPDVAKAIKEVAADLEATVAQYTKEAEITDIDEPTQRDIADKIDKGKLLDTIYARAEEIKNARLVQAGALHPAGLEKDLSEADRAKKDVVARVKNAGSVFDFMAEDAVTYDELMAKPTTNEAVRLLQKANDDMLFLASSCGMGNAKSHISRPQDLRCYGKWANVVSEVVRDSGVRFKAMDTTEGSAIAPTQYSADWTEAVFQRTNVAGLLPHFPWPDTKSSTLTVPTEGTEVRIYGSGEPTTDDDTPKFHASTPGIGTSTTVTAKVLTCRTIWSWEMDEDSIIPYLQHAQDKVMRANARDLDDAIVNGDTTATHFDTDTNLEAADHHCKQFLGMAHYGYTQTSTYQDMASTNNFETLMLPTMKMGAFAKRDSSDQVRATDCVFLCSFAWTTKMGWMKDASHNNVFLIGNYAGAPYAALSGQVPTIGGFQIVPTAVMRTSDGDGDLHTYGVASTGINTSAAGTSQDYTRAIWVYLPAWRIYEKSGLESWLVNRPEEGQRVFVTRRRLAVQHMYGDPSTGTTVSTRTTALVFGMRDDTV